MPDAEIRRQRSALFCLWCALYPVSLVLLSIARQFSAFAYYQPSSGVAEHMRAEGLLATVRRYERGEALARSKGVWPPGTALKTISPT